ncbi:MAG: RsmE family RNA methyltransferase [Fluviicola sp.]|jgi:16S rRNA (uracil1498-N3)-methyltransferase
MRRFYIPDLTTDSIQILPEEESKHIVRVLRMKIGDQLLLLNGKGLIVEAEISDEHPKKCQVKVLNSKTLVREDGGVHLAIAPTKNLDRIEWLTEKIVEIGATKLSFIQTENSERVNLKRERIERIAISALKQAKHDFLLEIEDLISFKDFIKKYPTGSIAHCIESEKKSIEEVIVSNRILIGPEGDFTQKEVDLALESGYEALNLGTARLRTETAGLVAVTLAVFNAEKQKN